jgi:hypothetical protein
MLMHTGVLQFVHPKNKKMLVYVTRNARLGVAYCHVVTGTAVQCAEMESRINVSVSHSHHTTTMFLSAHLCFRVSFVIGFPVESLSLRVFETVSVRIDSHRAQNQNVNAMTTLYTTSARTLSRSVHKVQIAASALHQLRPTIV